MKKYNDYPELKPEPYRVDKYGNLYRGDIEINDAEYDLHYDKYSAIRKDLISKRDSSYKNVKGGEKVMADKYRYKNPQKRREQFFNEMQTKTSVSTGKELSDTQLAYRSGYILAQRDSAEAYKMKQAQQTERQERKGLVGKLFKGRLGRKG